MIVRNILAVIGGATVVTAVVAGTAIVVMKKMADSIPDEMLEDTEPIEADELADELRRRSDGNIHRTPLSPTTT